ncbi:IclR family transcriptional regulator [Bradyrhizobium sp. LHD-71]|uniref:IclR family transcriptional regulator n=1 Tax=Bradyrhizobium sp. LHD-71 TaxID=3072141 RepID=UPI00280DF893|nr:IclR family transcriptional regulator [Bradyrhizobium sp. LHD-71]MDQ8727980.1 IclR family transcriptional regulator [Bradyrhizobium sp. LHD-71]
MNKGTVRVLNALSLFTQRPTWGVTELSRELKCSKNSAFQALDTLLKEGYLVRSSSGPRYQLGHRVLDFGLAAESMDVRSLCHPYLQRIHKLTNESVFLAILVGRSTVCIDSIQAQGVTVGYSPLSQPLPLHAGTGSRLLLAYLKDEEIERFIELESPLRSFTPTTITDPKALWDEVRLIRKTGFARGYQDFSTGANFLAFPVFGPMERLLATIVVGGPLFRFTREIADGFIPGIRALIDELNQHSRMFPAVPVVLF